MANTFYHSYVEKVEYLSTNCRTFISKTSREYNPRGRYITKVEGSGLMKQGPAEKKSERSEIGTTYAQKIKNH
jgi:hypothetical protein